MRTTKSFNPCFIGKVSATEERGPITDMGIQFQSLFYWKSLCNNTRTDTLNTWNPCFNPCFIGKVSATKMRTSKYQRKDVSILVLLEKSLQLKNKEGSKWKIEVSILVLLEKSLQHVYPGDKNFTIAVSILVLLEKSLQHQYTVLTLPFQ